MRVNEIFYSLQGEGTFTGTPSVFVRLSGCNLACPFCDTDFKAFKEYTEEELIERILSEKAHHVVVTGGEPTLQLTDAFLNALIDNGKEVQIETNGTHDIQNERVWITCSPKFEFVKNNAQIKLHRIDELKVVYNTENDMSLYNNIGARYFYLQPCDTGDDENNKKIIKETVEYCLRHPKWKLSLQTQKILNVR